MKSSAKVFVRLRVALILAAVQGQGVRFGAKEGTATRMYEPQKQRMASQETDRHTARLQALQLRCEGRDAETLTPQYLQYCLQYGFTSHPRVQKYENDAKRQQDKRRAALLAEKEAQKQMAEIKERRATIIGRNGKVLNSVCVCVCGGGYDGQKRKGTQ